MGVLRALRTHVCESAHLQLRVETLQPEVVRQALLHQQALEQQVTACNSDGGPMVRTQVRQSEGSGFKSRSGQIAYFHGVKIRLSTLGTGDVPRGSDST